MKIKQTIVLLLIVLSGVVFVYSSLWWTSEMVYSYNQLYDLRLGFPIPFMSYDYIGMDDTNYSFLKLPTEVGIIHSYQSIQFLPIHFLLNVILVSLVFWAISLYSSRYIETIKLIGGIWFLIFAFFLLKFFIIPPINSFIQKHSYVGQDMWQPVDLSGQFDQMLIEPTK